MVDRRSSEPQHLLPETKYYPPIMREDIIPRQRLLDDLGSVLFTHPLTLLSAPAGYGKTTLLSLLYSTCPELSLTWLSLDQEDDDPARFLTGLIFSLQRLNPDFGTTASSLLSSLSNPDPEMRRVMSALINDVLEIFTEPFAMILDDLHLVSEPTIFVGLNYLLEHLPPRMHLVISSRRDPALALARLRGRGQVAEIRLAKLRFTDEEAMTFLNDRLGLNLSPIEVSLLQSRAEGWAVGLRLLAGSLDQITTSEDRNDFFNHLVQMDRHIFDFLAEEVFNSQEAEVKKFLLETSILPELTAELCRGITEKDDAGLLLEEIYRRNLFLVRIESQPGQMASNIPSWLRTDLAAPQTSYRYHDLFADFLYNKLFQEHQELVPILHLRAARAQDDPSRAVGHYLAAERWSDAVEIIEKIGAELFTHGYIDTLSRWINSLPESVRETHPRLLHYLSNCAVWKGDWSEVESLLERSLEGFNIAGDEAGQGEVLVNLATLALLQADFERSAMLFDRTLALATSPHIRVQAMLGSGSVNMELGDWEQAEKDLNTAMALIQQSGELDLLHLVTFPYFDPGFAFLPGGLEHLEHVLRQARALIGDEVSSLRLVIEEMATVLHLFRGQLDEVIRSGEKALALRERLGSHPFLGIESDMFLIMAHTARGDYADVEPYLDSLFAEVELTNSPTIDVADLLFAVGRIYWLHGRVEDAREIYTRMCTLEDPRQELPAARICRTWMWSLLEMADGRYSEAERALIQPEVLEQTDRRSTITGSTRLMLARLYLLQNRQNEALAELAPVLEYHEKLDLPFVILAEGQSIVPLLHLAVARGVHESYATYLLEVLGVTSKMQSVHITRTGETLTPREAEVLRLVVAGYSNREIAEHLVISVWTVKSHLTKIYQKMDVTSRTQAIVYAHDLGLR